MAQTNPGSRAEGESAHTAPGADVHAKAQHAGGYLRALNHALGADPDSR